MKTAEDRDSEGALRLDFVAKDAYLSKEWLQAEKERLWPRVWQIACRVEELQQVGDYVTYDIADESVIVARTSEERIEAFFNVCQHRGRRLTQGCGRTNVFRCRYHGWTWKLDGTLARVQSPEDWDGCPGFSPESLRLPAVRVGLWGGFVFVNMDPEAEPLEEFLRPLPEYLNGFEFDKWRFRWYKTTVLPCNWKTALEGFNEAYHVASTHPQLLDHMGDDATRSVMLGRHGMYYYPPDRRPLGAPASRTNRPMPEDLRPGIVRHYDELNETLRAMYSPRSVEATHRLLTEVEATSDAMRLYSSMEQFQRQAAVASGAGWPQMSAEQRMKAGTEWHLFPNHVFLMLADASIAYRARPNGDDPDSCIFDIWSLQRYAPGAEPPLEREFIADWRANTQADFGLILSQDFQNFEQVQRGMKSRGFRGARTNPRQESEIPNMHRALREYLYGSAESSGRQPHECDGGPL
jgi:phenylpropionate dioxygenase-like ring-hydroxylating dioxygenase large terminal subunit